MKALRSPVVTVALVLTACATGVNQELPDEEGGGGSAGTTADGGTTSTAGKPATGSSGSVGTAGATTNPFGGTGSTAGKSSGGASGSGGANAAGASSAGNGGKATGGTGGTGGGGKAGSAGTAGASGSGGSGGSAVVGMGSCSGTAAFMVGAGNKYAVGAKVVAECDGGTPCTMATPAGVAGQTYEFSCLDQYNCGSQNPGKTNWSTPPWKLTKECTP